MKLIGIKMSEILIYFCNFIMNYIPSHHIRDIFYKKAMKFRINKKGAILLGVKFNCRGNFTLGQSVINQNCSMDNRGGIQIGDSVSIGPEVMIITADHDLASKDFVGKNAKVIIEDYVFIGGRAIILPGVIIGKGAVICAGALVNKSVDPYTYVAGIPAKKIGERTKDLDYQLTYKRFFH